MAELKNKATDASVDDFLANVDEHRQGDCQKIMKLLQEVTGEKPRMWGPSMIGFGSYHYKYASGREGDWFITGFSPRKKDYTIYINSGLDNHGDLLQQLGKHKTGKSCLYIRKLEDINWPVLKELVKKNNQMMK